MIKDPPTVLLVEDDRDDEELTIRGLRRANLQNPIDVASDGQDALDYLFGTDGQPPRIQCSREPGQTRAQLNAVANQFTALGLGGQRPPAFRRPFTLAQAQTSRPRGRLEQASCCCDAGNIRSELLHCAAAVARTSLLS